MCETLKYFEEIGEEEEEKTVAELPEEAQLSYLLRVLREEEKDGARFAQDLEVIFKSFA